MVKNSDIINKTNNHLSSQTVEQTTWPLHRLLEIQGLALGNLYQVSFQFLFSQNSF
jgi:hypothetical protein